LGAGSKGRLQEYNPLPVLASSTLARETSHQSPLSEPCEQVLGCWSVQLGPFPATCNTQLTPHRDPHILFPDPHLATMIEPQQGATGAPTRIRLVRCQGRHPNQSVGRRATPFGIRSRHLYYQHAAWASLDDSFGAVSHIMLLHNSVRSPPRSVPRLNAGARFHSPILSHHQMAESPASCPMPLGRGYPDRDPANPIGSQGGALDVVSRILPRPSLRGRPHSLTAAGGFLCWSRAAKELGRMVAPLACGWGPTVWSGPG